MATRPKRISFSLIVFLIALVIRLVPVIAARELTIGLDDMFQYDMLGRSLAAGNGYRWYAEDDLALVEKYLPLDFIYEDYDPTGVPATFRPPGYPMFLAVIYRLFGLENRFFITRLVQAIILAALAPMTYALSRRLFPHRERTAQISSLIIACYPFLIVYPLALATEVTFIPLTLGAALALLRAGETRRWGDFLLDGVLLGAAALTRSVILGLLPFLLLWVWFAVKDRKGALIVLASVLVLTVPWMVRNTRLHGELTLIENAMGYTLYMGYHPETEGRFEFGPSLDLVPYLDDAQRNEIGMEKALGFIRQAPERVPVLMLRKLGYFFGLERRALTYFYSNDFFGYIPQPWFTMVFALFMLPFMVITCGAVLSLPVLKWNKTQVLAAIFIFGYLAPHLLLLSEPRFHLALVPFFAVYAAHVWVQRRAILAASASPKRHWKLALAVGLVALLVFNWGFELWSDAEAMKLLFGPEGNQTYFPY
jgi:hypothetical protein